MILCVTLNPCLDKTLTVPRCWPGDLVRGTEVREVGGGKGNNVARALKHLGRHSRPVRFLGGAIGSHSERLLRSDDGLEPLAVASGAPTRVSLTVRTGERDEQTAFFEPDPAISPHEAETLSHAIDDALSTGEVEVRLADKRSFPADRAAWLKARDAVYEDVMAKGWSQARGSFVQSYGSDALDASALLMPLTFFAAPNDPRMLATVDPIRAPAARGGLAADGLVYRYDPKAAPDGLPGVEGEQRTCRLEPGIDG